MDGLDETMESERYGELEARSFDLRLRELESREREDRLTRLIAERPDLLAAPSAVPAPFPAQESAVVERLQREVALLAEFQSALVHSKGWHLLQALRRPFGRAW